MNTLWIGLGGAIGTIARYHLAGYVQRRLGASFPYGTLSVNVVGSFLLALVMYLGLRSELLPPNARIVLATGVLGGFTTYSSFNYETLGYLQEGAWGVGALNIAATLLGCLVAGVLGWGCGRFLLGA